MQFVKFSKFDSHKGQKLFYISNFFPDEFRPDDLSESDMLPTIHPNSVLPYHPLDPEYEDYTYDEELEHVTQPFVPSQHTVSQHISQKSSIL